MGRKNKNQGSGKARAKGRPKGRRRGESISPWDNIQMSWDTPPDRVRLKTDASVSISWPFGDDIADMMSSLTDEYFRVFMKKAWALCQHEAATRPASGRSAFLQAQRERLDGYRDARARKKR